MKSNPWPLAIICYFVVFISGIVIWVTFAMRHDEELVHPDYYALEIAHQKQMDRMARTAALGDEVKVALHEDSQTLVIRIPGNDETNKPQGEVHLYRPSDAKLDQEFLLSLDEHHSQVINVAGLPRGLWKVRLNWTVQDREYFHEEVMVLSSH